jgi:predicted ATPase
LSLAQALVFAAAVHQFRREAPAAHEQAAAATTLATERGFALYLARGTAIHGWALAMQGQGEAGIAAIRQGLAADLATGSTLWQPYFLGLLAEAYGADGYPEEGLAALAEARAVLETTEGRFYAAEIPRLQGALLLKQAVPDASQAAACFHQALDVARHQQAKSWELRAATSLARLWQSQRSARRPTTCSLPCTSGLPKALTRRMCRRPKYYFRTWKAKAVVERIGRTLTPWARYARQMFFGSFAPHQTQAFRRRMGRRTRCGDDVTIS